MEVQSPGKKQFEARLIQLLSRRFEAAQLKVQDHFKVGELPLEIDLLANFENEAYESLANLPPLFHYFQRHNLFELKTEVDPLTLADLVKLQAYAWHYMFKEELYVIADVTATALVHHVPAPVLKALPALGYEPYSNGVFKRKSDLVSFLISIEDVPDELVPEELLVFSNRERRKRVFSACVNQPEKQPLVDAITDLYQKEVIEMMNRINVHEEFMPQVIDALGRKRVLAALSKEELMASLSKEELMASLSKEEHMAALSEDDLLAALQMKEPLLKALLAKMEPERLHKLIAEVGRG